MLILTCSVICSSILHDNQIFVLAPLHANFILPFTMAFVYVYFWQHTLSTSQRWFSELVSEQFSLHSISQNKLGIIPFYLLSVLSATGMIQMPDQICLLLYTNLKKQYVNPKNENVLLNYEYFLRALRTPPVQLLQEGRGHFGHCLYLY